VEYLIDSDWVIDCLNGIHRVARRFDELQPYGVGISIVSTAELFDGAYGSMDPEREELVLSEFLSHLEVVRLDEDVCRIFAMERRRLRAAGTPIGDMDLFIGATAIRHGLTLLTNNRRHFERLQGLSILSV
jgi:tRNA(fMet)-specific endonuclease VapC